VKASSIEAAIIVAVLGLIFYELYKAASANSAAASSSSPAAQLLPTALSSALTSPDAFYNLPGALGG
jgi:hypothetical protein